MIFNDINDNKNASIKYNMKQKCEIYTMKSKYILQNNLFHLSSHQIEPIDSTTV